MLWISWVAFTWAGEVPPPPIIHGEPATVEDYPMTGGLIVSGEAFGIEQRLLMCSSTLIAPDVVLAAAHCVDIEAMAEEYGVVVENIGFTWSREADLREYSLNLTTLPDWPEDAAHAAAWSMHPEWDMMALQTGLAQNYDISLIFLEEPLAGVPIAFLPRPEEGEQVAVGAEVAVVGWGQQTADAETSPVGTKQMGMSTISEVADWEFKVGDVESDVRKCHGDSGGPSFQWMDVDTPEPMRLVGVTSHAYDRTDCAVTGGVDTRVDAYLDWIDEEMRARCADGTRSWCALPGILYAPDPREVEAPRGCATAGAGGWAALAAAALTLGRRGASRRGSRRGEPVRGISA